MNIYDYFNEETEYPNVCKGEIMPFNHLYSEVNTSLLDAFINSCEKHLFCYTLDRYRHHEKEKESFVKKINAGEYKKPHTHISDIEDDVVILSKIAGGYMWFWYHLSGRCDIGRFKTADSIEKIEENIVNWLREMIDEHCVGFTKLDVSFLRGYISFS